MRQRVKSVFLLLVLLIITTNAWANSQQTPIMGTKEVSKQQMIQYLRNNNQAKSYDYAKNFAEVTLEEATIEGVRADVAFALMMKETNFLKFGGDVKPEQNNFGGLGATGNGEPGLSFIDPANPQDPRLGIRAIIQHLQAYATTAPLKQTCIDPRYQYVQRGSAPYVEWLGIQENPNGTGWATDGNYGYDIVARVNTMKQIVPPLAVVSSLSTDTNFYVTKIHTITANAVSSNGTLYRFWVRDNNEGIWRVVKNWSESATLNWKPIKTGSYRILVQVKDKNSINSYDDSTYKNVEVKPLPPATLSSMTLDSDRFYVAGSYQVKANASSINQTLYRFWLRDNRTGVWQVVRNWSETSTYTWKPTKTGSFRILVQVKDINSKQVYDDVAYKNLEVKYPPATISSLTLSSNLFYVSNPYQVKASASSINKILYRFWLRDNTTGIWQVVRNWSEISTYTWKPTKTGSFRILVQVKDINSKQTYDDSAYKNVEVTTLPPAEITSFTLPSAFHLGSTFVISGKAESVNTPLYRFWLRDASNTWRVVRDWSESNTFSWKPSKAGKYRILMQAKDPKSQNNYDDSVYRDVTVLGLLAGKTIVLDPGHGGNDPGAVNSILGLREKDLNIQLAAQTYNKLKALGANVIFTRQPGNDIYLSLQQRVQIANNAKADLFLSIHHDSSTSSTANGSSSHYSSYRPGIETNGAYVRINGVNYPFVREDTANGLFYYMDGSQLKSVSYYSSATAYDSSPSIAATRSAQLAAGLARAMAELGYTNRGSRDHNLYVTRWTTMPSVLVEAGFISNLTDAQRAKSPLMQDQMAQKIVNEIIKLF